MFSCDSSILNAVSSSISSDCITDAEGLEFDALFINCHLSAQSCDSVGVNWGMQRPHAHFDA
jgi:hypothetical protein